MKIKKAIFLDRDGTLIKGIIKQNQKNFDASLIKKELHIYEDLTHLREFLSKYYLFILLINLILKGTSIEKFNNLINSSLENNKYKKYIHVFVWRLTQIVIAINLHRD